MPVARKKASAQKQAQSLAKKAGRDLQPVVVEGRKIARTFWGKAWCENLERYSDFENRLPRGRSYARNGSVIDLMIGTGQVDAMVAGRDTYTVQIKIDALKPATWKRIKADCAASIDSLMDLLAGRFSDSVMERLTQKDGGLFPQPKEIRMSCSCPDWATVCKHVAATFYGVAVQLDDHPDLLFRLRDVDHNDLVSEAVAEGNLETAFGSPNDDLGGADLGELFGIELDSAVPPVATSKKTKRKKAAKKKSASRGAKAAVASKKKPQTVDAPNAKKKTAVSGPSKKKVAKKAVKKKAVKKKAAKAAKKTAAVKKVAAVKKAAKKRVAKKKLR